MIDIPAQQLGNYRLLRLLGEGGFAEVYLAEHMYLKTYAAIKVLHARLASEKQEEFLAEARSIAHLKHFNIVRVLEFGVEGNIPFLVMDYAPDGTLRQRHPLGTRVPLADIVTYVKQISAALQHAHSRQIIHRDIKPENILLGAHHKLLLSDFGIARVVKTALEQRSQEVIGTIMYMAPEQLQNRPCPASDQYSLATVIYEWLSGDYLFRGSFAEIASQHLLAPPPSFREKGINAPSEIEKTVMKALAKDPQQRFATVQDFATALEQSYQTMTPVLLSSSSNSTIQEVSTHPLADHPTRSLPELPQTLETISDPVRSRTSSRPSPGKILLFAAAILLTMISSSGLTYYLTVLRPASQQSPTQPAQNTATAQATGNSPAVLQDLYTKVTSAEPAFNSPLNANDNNSWLEYDSKTFGSCTFKKGAYYASTALGSPYNACSVTHGSLTNFSDFAYQVEMTIIRGDKGGIEFRLSGGYYSFFIDKDGYYSFSSFYYTSNTILNDFSPLVVKGLKQVNTITVIARGSHFYFYVNKHYIAQANDSSFTEGAVGVAAQYTTHVTEVAFRNAQVWKL